MKVEIEESKLQTAYANACDGVKDFMESLFGKKVFEAAKPTLDDYKTIRTYEDACVALKQDAIRVDSVNGDTTTVLTNLGARVNIPSHIVALMKLETISRALWGRNFQPKPDGEGSKVYWYPWFALWTKKEVEDMNPEQRGALLSAYAGTGATAGFGFLFAIIRSSYAYASFGFRLCQETEEKAKYFGQQFIELWAEYLKFNFTVGNRLK
ncbi:hypothetical protein [Bacteroides fragilis]|uniref:Uncharacterized protein n=1 Tax=Bacteroides fragilis str. 3783N1-6 TaxID=1339310 RepID=A0AB73AE60_BACFG|nr:hypothetical protein [Bacteroides fragilis]EXZ65907.1 hypothetical protein M120_4707 [Bacteroides fragilis str. 3783N1-8]EYB07443.1 hypothetical protein M119_4521 [Bacteroides fragilis str. 3783N1-6]